MALNKLAVGFLLCTTALSVAPASAQAASAHRTSFDIPAGDLGSALRGLSRQARIDVIFSAAELKGLRTSGISGSFSVQEALVRLVRGSGAEILPDPSGAYLVRRAAKAMAGPDMPRGTALASTQRPARAGGYQSDPQTVPQAEDAIVVTAIRRSIETAQAVKRDSDEIVDSVVAEDVGKLPDVTAAESLARVTGVQVTRAEGEASGTRVRGLPDLTTTYNGREIFTAEGRSVALQDFPSGSIARMDVYKSGSANLVEAGIAGLIDVRSRKPLDFKGGRVTGGISGVHWYQSQDLALDANLLVSQRWHTGIGEIGLLVEGSYTNNNFLDSSRNVSQSILNRTGVAGAPAAIRYPSFINIDYVTGKRWRPSASAAFQWRPSRQLEFYLDGLFQGYRARNAGRNFVVNTGPAATLSNITYIDGTNQIRSATMTGGGVPTGTQNSTSANTDTYQAGGGFIWKQGRLRLTGDAALTDSTYTQLPLAFNYTLTTAPTRTFDFDSDVGAGGGTVSLSNFDLFNPASYRMTSMSDGGTRNHGRSVQARLDVEYRLAALGIASLQAGIRFSNRDADARNYSRSGNAPAGQFFTVLPLEYESASTGFNNDALDTVRTWLTPSRDSLLAQADTLRRLVGLAPGRPAFAAPVYTANEKSYTGYVQAKYAFDIGIPIDGLIGLRAVRTETRIDGTATVSGAAGTPISRSVSYDDFLPNVSMRLKFARDFQLRLAFTQTRTRPTFGNLNPSITVSVTGTCPSDTTLQCRPASSGNPNLSPTRSTNYDASLEYYFSRTGSVTVGAFHRDVTGFINNTTTEIVDPTYGRLNYTRPENGGRGRISGVEAGFRTFLRAPWLPRWTRDFGVLTNYTYLDHKSELAPTLAATLPGFQPLAGVSKHLVNLSGFYENRWFSARLSYNYRSDFVVSYGQVADPALNNALGPTLPVIEDGRGTVDLSTSLSPNEHFTLSFNVTNLLGQAGTNARIFNTQGQSYPWQTRFLETVYRLGVRFRF